MTVGMPVVAIAMAIAAVVAIASVMAVYAVDPLLILHS
jgi:hypothetical protein